MLGNVKEGKPSHEGITKEEISEALSYVRQNRTAAASEGGKAKAKTAKAKKAPVPFDAKGFTDIDLD